MSENREVARILRDYLADRLAASRRYRVITGDKIRSALNREQANTRKLCFAKSCQLRVGRALAADRSLSTRVMRLGKSCVVTATLYDLETQVTEKGAKAEVPCDEEGIKRALDQVVVQLAGQPDAANGTAGSDPLPAEASPVVSGGDVTVPTARLIVKVRPKSARVQVTGPGGFASNGGSSWEQAGLKPGAYKVVAGARGFISASRELSLGVDDLQTVKLTLERPGRLEVTGKPAGSRVEVTGPGGFSTVKGMPLSVRGAAPGHYKITVSRQGYLSIERDVTVMAERTATVEIHLRKATRGGRDELDDLIDAAISGPKKTLTKGEIQKGMRSIKKRVYACYNKYKVPGLCEVKVTIGRSGKISDAQVKGAFRDTPTGACVVKAVPHARFMKFTGEPIVITYPFILR